MAELTVASFNTHWGADRHGQPFDVVGVCLALDADVLVLQEAWRPHGRRSYVDDLVDATGSVVHETVFMSDRNPARPRFLRPPPGPAGTCGLAVLTRLPVCEVAEIVLPRAQGDVIEQRHSLLLTVSAGGTAVSLAAMHASHRLWGSLPQVRCVDRALRVRGNPSAIVGDLNMWGPPVALAIPGRRRAVRGRTWPATRPHSQIDHVWIDDRLHPVAGGIGPATGSDHRPIWARLRVRGPSDAQ
jgi:endonuclease/exonuclease/phosphatase family metal-dependent hydrolase